jgi:hypothetical protein
VNRPDVCCKRSAEPCELLGGWTVAWLSDPLRERQLG